MLRIEITDEADSELRERIARYSYPTGLMIVPGPLHEEYRGGEPEEELSILYPSQRWCLSVVALESFDALREYPSMFRTANLSEISVGIFTANPPASFKIQLEEDSIHVFESAA